MKVTEREVRVKGISITQKIKHVFSLLQAYDGFILASGVCALIVGVLVDVFILRLLCLLIVIASAVLVYLSLHTKRSFLSGTLDREKQHHPPQSVREEMKKLIFDDFQAPDGRTYHVEEIDDERHDAQSSAGDTTPAGVPGATFALNTLQTLKPETKSEVKEFQVSDFFDIDSDIFKGDAEPRTEFNFLLTKALGAIREVLFAHSAAFFWANREKMQIVMEARVTEGIQPFSPRRHDIGEDLVSNVAQSGRPELITEINPIAELDLLPSYESPSGIRSFVGVPVYFPGAGGREALAHPVGVLAVDSKAEDAFGQETLILLGHFTKLISGLIKSYTEKYDLLVGSELLRSIGRMQEKMKTDFTPHTFTQALAEEASKLVTWDYLSIVIYDEKKPGWSAKKVTSRAHERYIVLDQVIDYPGSLVGQTIRNNTFTMIDDLSVISTPRYVEHEGIEGKGSFVSIPISSLNKCYGALTLECRKTGTYTKQDVEVLTPLAQQTAAALETYYMNEVIKEYVIIDDVTGLYSRKFFVQKMEEELQRADECGTELSLLFITLDRAPEIAHRFGPAGYEKVVVTLSRAIRASVRPYDIVGRYEDDRFGVLLINTAANDAYLWAEKIRKSVAAIVINIDQRTFSITISLGVCGALEGMKKEELLGNTTTVLNKAADAGGNAVRVF